MGQLFAMYCCFLVGQVRQMYGVPKDLLGLLEGRQTYVIGKDGTVKLVYNSQFKARRPPLRPARPCTCS